MPANEIHVGDIGTAFLVTIKDGDGAINISAAGVKNLKFQKPDYSTLTVPATFVSGGSDGVIQYITVSGDLDQAGTWKVQGRIEISPSGWNSDIHSFKVYRNL